jgi:hypothetical protein
MRPRTVLLTLVLSFLFALPGCTSKPPANNENSPPPSSNAATDSSGGGSAGGAPAPNNASAPANVPAPTPEPLVVPAGTTLTVRLVDTLSSKSSTEGQPFQATVTTPIEVAGKTAIPSGATASGTVVTAHPAGRFKGASLLEIRLNSIAIHGHPFNIETSSVSRGEKGKGKRTAGMIGGGAGVGALIGGLAGGGKGAAIGAIAGAGAGTAGAGLTGNRDVTLPAESAVSFTLASTLSIPQ